MIRTRIRCALGTSVVISSQFRYPRGWRSAGLLEPLVVKRYSRGFRSHLSTFLRMYSTDHDASLIHCVGSMWHEDHPEMAKVTKSAHLSLPKWALSFRIHQRRVPWLRKGLSHVEKNRMPIYPQAGIFCSLTPIQKETTKGWHEPSVGESCLI